jgi:hypothetical protein
MPVGCDGEAARRDLLSRGALVAVTAILGARPRAVEARDYASRREALDEMDRLAAVCGMRLGTVRRSRGSAGVLVSRFLTALEKHKATREDVRRRFALPRGEDPGSQVGTVDDDLPGLRQSLDDLMIAYAESLPVFADAKVVSRLAVDMVEVSKLRTVIDLWVESEMA